jgi:uncharacterized membrane protein YedE/YeeE
MNQKQGATPALISGAVLVAVTAYAWASGRWVLTAIPIGVLFGFFLQKGDLCGSSAFSEVVLARDWRKVWGLWVAVVVSMAGIAVGDLMDWIQLSPKPLMWALVMVGGVVFGIGMVLAGGCVSGCLYKGASGNLNSIVALVAMPFGIALVEYGPLEPWYKQLKAMKVPASDGGAVTLSSLTGLPFWLLALVIAAATVAGAVLFNRRARAAQPEGEEAPGAASSPHALTRSWRPWQAGIAIGLLALPAYLSSAASGRNYPLGVTHGVLQAALLVTDAPVQHVVASPSAASAPKAQTDVQPRKKVVWWLVLLVAGVMVGSHLSGRMSGQARLLPKPPEQVLVAALGGFLVGAGAALATGCVIGNILSGWALMSVGMVLFGVVTILANWGTTLLYLRGLH